MEEIKDINAIIGSNLLKLRKKMKLTQLEIAEKFNYSDKSISKWEKGESLPSIEVLYQLAQFYGVTLNDLTEENENIEITENKKEEKVKIKTPRMFSPKLIITLLSVGAVWLLATVSFVVLKLCLNKNFFMNFMWAGVISCIVLIIFISVWGKMKYFFPVLSVLLWLLLTSIHIEILITIKFNIWPIYILGIPLQILIILWGALIKKPKGYYKKKREEQAIQNNNNTENN
ncbi:MAG: helix-turn-helix transcriptional regulator [Clostridia bacterium]|nr:helix-turn-helix transcriptional regulator [Clostridia bacterium]